MMRLALSGTELEPGEPLTELIAGARELAVRHVELWYPRNTDAAGVEATLDQLDRAGLRVACVSTGSELYRNQGADADVDLLLAGIRLAGRCDAPFANTYFGYASRVDDELAIATYRRNLAPCLEEAERLGVTIVLENEFNAFGVDPAKSDITRRPPSLRRLFEAVNHPRFRLNFDASNFYCAGVEAFPYAFRQLTPFIAYVHVKDCCRFLPENDMEAAHWKIYTDSEDRYLTQPLGEGAVNWRGLLAALPTAGYAGFLTLEPHADGNHRRVAWKQARDFMAAELGTSLEDG
jgi:sugar phosphate isomerase/epimerase